MRIVLSSYVLKDVASVELQNRIRQIENKMKNTASKRSPAYRSIPGHFIMKIYGAYIGIFSTNARHSYCAHWIMVIHHAFRFPDRMQFTACVNFFGKSIYNPEKMLSRTVDSIL